MQQSPFSVCLCLSVFFCSNTGLLVLVVMVCVCGGYLCGEKRRGLQR